MSITVTLDPLPALAYIGDVVTFSGNVVKSDGSPLIGGYMTLWWTNHYRYVRDSEGNVPIGHTDSNGQFSIPWTVWNQDSLMIGEQQFQAIENNNSIFSNTQGMSVAESPDGNGPPPPPPPPPPPTILCPTWMRILNAFAVKHNRTRLKSQLDKMAESRECSLSENP